VKRRIVTRAIKSIEIKEVEDKILKNVRNMCNQLIEDDGGKDWSEPKDMTKFVAYCTSDIMGDTTFSRSWNMLHSEENRDMYYVLPRGIGGLSLVSRREVHAEHHRNIILIILGRPYASPHKT